MERIGRSLRIVGGIDARVARRRERMAGHFAGTVAGGEGDDELVASDSNPDPLADEGVRHGIAGRAEAERRVVIDEPGDTERDRMSLGRDRVQPRSFGCQSIRRGFVRLAMGAGVDGFAEGVAGSPQLGERAVCSEEVRFGRHEVGLGDPDSRFAAALGLRIERHAGGDLEPIVAAGGDDLRMTHADPRDPVSRVKILGHFWARIGWVRSGPQGSATRA